ncbi:NCK-interacting protein with SH3 domain isoform X1 [Leptopilina boulardi]|uniref:NCK-interacting protein with SH3 domain isoform X1 n=1 Tax=Leptopilina boulardi TaxID=63433 RepID=UPI0021F53479|nr:NCK-interacting protein with SH3 domain isoform X1 [Leptopilina boulardi]
MGDNNQARLGNYEMLRALYDFNATFHKALSFRENDLFVLLQSNTKQRNWWQVINKEGQVGFIPSNYATTEKVQPQFFIDFLDECIKLFSVNNDKQESSIVTDRQAILSKLEDKKRYAEQGKKTKKQAPMPPDFGNTTPDKDNNELIPIVSNNSTEDNKSTSSNATYASIKSNNASNENDQNEKSNKIETALSARRDSATEKRRQSLTRQSASEAILPPDDVVQKNICENIKVKSPNHSPVKNKTSSTADINPRTAYHLLDQVRRNTQLSYEMSKVAVSVVVVGLYEILPHSVSHYLEEILNQLQVPLTVSKMTIEETYDANRLKVIFKELTSCKEDSQQRSWMLYEDESIILEYIKELTSILTNADANVSRYVLRQDQYNGVTTLIQYYQMEPRWTIRQLLLQSFGVMCSLDPIALTIMLNSILPMEMARDMRANPRNVSKLNYSSLLLTMIFSMGEPMPITHLEQLGMDFIEFLFELIENPPDNDLDDQIPDLFVNLILSYNLQFMASENIVLNALKGRTIAKIFTEKILFLLNREEDPVRIFDHQPAPPDSVLKMFVDLFSKEVTANLFYTNDVKVLIDIILRQLFDISPGDRRRQYLELCRRVLRTSNYNDHRHRSEDVLKSFTRIFCEETAESQEDQQLVRDISNEFPHLFQM